MILYSTLELRGAKEIKDFVKLFFEDQDGESVTYFMKKQDIIDKGLTLKKGAKFNLTLDGQLKFSSLKEIKGA